MAFKYFTSSTFNICWNILDRKKTITAKTFWVNSSPSEHDEKPHNPHRHTKTKYMWINNVNRKKSASFLVTIFHWTVVISTRFNSSKNCLKKFSFRQHNVSEAHTILVVVVELYPLQKFQFDRTALEHEWPLTFSYVSNTDRFEWNVWCVAVVLAIFGIVGE